MADIRYTTVALDDFNRGGENPIASPWDRNWGVSDMQLIANHCRGTDGNPSNTNDAFLTTHEFAGDEIEAWATVVTDIPLHESLRIGLQDDAAGISGYLLRVSQSVLNSNWEIRKYTSSSFTSLANPVGTLPVDGDLVLLQLTASTVRGYLSTDGGANWTQQVSVSDTTYRSGLFIHLGANGTGGGWDDPGGGIPIDYVPEFIRRPWEYQGRVLTPA